MANVLVSYEGRERLTVDLSGVDPTKRVIRGDTLYMRPRSTKVMTEEEWAIAEKNCPKEQLRFLRIQKDTSKKQKALAKIQKVKTQAVPKPAEKTAKGVAERAERLAKTKAEVKGPLRVVVDGPPNPVAALTTVSKEAEGATVGAATKGKGDGKEASSKGPPKRKTKEVSAKSP